MRLLIEQAKTMGDTQLDSALILNRQIVVEAAKANLLQLVWDSRYEESKILSKLGQKDSALFLLNELINEAKNKADTIQQLKAFSLKASIQQRNYDFKSAIENLLIAQELLSASTPFDLRFDVLNILGQTHRKMKDYESALKYYRILELDFSFQLSNRQKYLVFMNEGNVYADQKDYLKTEEFFQKAYQECKQLGEPEEMAQLTYNMGALYYRQKKYPEALTYTQQALSAYIEIGDKLRIERCYRVLGAIQYDQSNYSGANQFYLKALKIAEEIENRKSILGNLKNLYLCSSAMAKANKSLSDYAKALDYQSEWSALKDSLYQADLANQLLELEKKYETDQKNAEIALLGKENQLQADELLLERQHQLLMWLGIGFLLLVMAVVLYFMFYYRKVSAMLKQQSKLIFEQKEQITDQNVQLQKSVSTQNKLFSIIAHDLRSPLVSVSNFVQLLNFYLHDGRYEDISKMAVDMDRKNEQVLDLTDNLLLWAQSQSGGMNPQLQRINLNEILDECYELYLPVAMRKGVALELTDADDCQLWADRDMVRTICRNLINNALKFTPKDGKVRIDYRCNEAEARVSVSDTGLGIKPEKLQRLFSLDREDVRYGTDGEKSSGLGLSVCKEFCDILNGKIDVTSTEGIGSTFSFTLPKYSDELQELAELKAKQAATAS
ncbi:ATP-binding protein [Mangrovibacterium diazotrophicum]|uniref:ATP-binding protein n=1 Tax=Mangrovibacterium diazotrophicum TaxID=1261403 RepID=UPI001472D45C|nr:tetratricopeptide repeat-containing sensor histidine kinase [Mangrovibacterium diazotrophicum]